MARQRYFITFVEYKDYLKYYLEFALCTPLDA
jgi:hypothetical protein